MWFFKKRRRKRIIWYDDDDEDHEKKNDDQDTNTMKKKVSHFHKREDAVRGKQKLDEAFKMVHQLMGGVWYFRVVEGEDYRLLFTSGKECLKPFLCPEWHESRSSTRRCILDQLSIVS